MSKQTTSEDTPKCICSPALEYGQPLSDSQESPTLDLFGVEVAPARDTALLEKEKAQARTETYGRYLPASSESVALQRSMENKLRQLFDSVGSTVYAQTWKKRITPSGASLLEHTARGRTTSGSGCGGWQTPQASDEQRDRCGDEAMQRWKDRPNSGSELAAQVRLNLAGWPTPRSNETIAAREARGTKASRNLEAEAALTSGPNPDGTNAATENQGESRPSVPLRLNPAFSLWLMMGPLHAAHWMVAGMAAYSRLQRKRKGG